MKLHFLVHHVNFDDSSLSTNLSTESTQSIPSVAKIVFSEKKTSQYYETNYGSINGERWNSSVITFTFDDLQNKSIDVKMISTESNIIGKLEIPCSIFPFDHRVNTKFLMQNESPKCEKQRETEKNKKTEQNEKIIKIDNKKEPNKDNNVLTMKENFIGFPESNVRTNKKCRSPKIFLMIHLCTYGQLPFIAKKGSLLKHLKDATKRGNNPNRKRKIVSKPKYQLDSNSSQSIELGLIKGKSIMPFLERVVVQRASPVIQGSSETLLSNMLVKKF